MGLTIPSYSESLYLYWTYGSVVYIFPVYTVYIYIYIYISLQYIYLCLMQQGDEILKTIIFGMVHS